MTTPNAPSVQVDDHLAAAERLVYRLPRDGDGVKLEAARDLVARLLADRALSAFGPDREALLRRIRAARVVSEEWRANALGWRDLAVPGRLMAHPLALVLLALDGELDPRQLGVDPDTFAAQQLEVIWQEAERART